MDLIKRSYQITYRAKKDNNKKIIQGYAVVFDAWTYIDGCWDECVAKGAFKDSLKENNILALYNHDFNNVIARKDVNMKLTEDENGLRFEIELPDTTQANDLYELIDKGIVNQCSFAGYVRQDTWRTDNDKVYRIIQDVDLIEITITPIPAYEVTEAEVKRGQELRSKTKKINFEDIIKQSKSEIQKIDSYERGLK